MINDLDQLDEKWLKETIEEAESIEWPTFIELSGSKVAALARIALAAKPKSIIVNLGESTKEEIDALVSRINSEKGMPFIHADKQAKPEIPEGYKLVPIEPTQEMVDACFEGTCSGGIQKGYREMLAAAPAPEELC